MYLIGGRGSGATSLIEAEDGVLLNYGPRTGQVLTSVVEQLYDTDTDGAA
ncbi:hypothetical protein SAMN05216505_101708 [Streptomyces prasinopilosus]|uniref:Uncharacterized protein n=1 Tax=Streptomyces prasinopilosus TaxID=67344 RepID=A0A1G6JK07_9ACTN|nr:hypothetical protein SAMN05216505_101708 [Streptomyces prasinopilosus]